MLKEMLPKVSVSFRNVISNFCHTCSIVLASSVIKNLNTICHVDRCWKETFRVCLTVKKKREIRIRRVTLLNRRFDREEIIDPRL